MWSTNQIKKKSAVRRKKQFFNVKSTSFRLHLQRRPGEKLQIKTRVLDRKRADKIRHLVQRNKKPCTKRDACEYDFFWKEKSAPIVCETTKQNPFTEFIPSHLLHGCMWVRDSMRTLLNLVFLFVCIRSQTAPSVHLRWMPLMMSLAQKRMCLWLSTKVRYKFLNPWTIQTPVLLLRWQRSLYQSVQASRIQFPQRESYLWYSGI